MNHDFDCEPAHFKPVSLFDKCGGHRVFYKGKAKQAPETEQERALAEVAREKWARYQDIGVKAENAFMGKVDAMGTEASNQFARGLAASATNAKFSDRPQPQKAGLGVGLNSGAAKNDMFGKAMARAEAGAENTMGAALTREDQHAGGIRQVVAMGQGQSAQAQSGLTDLASSANQKAASDAVNDFNSRAANMEAAGTLVGAGVEMKYGDQLRNRRKGGLSRTPDMAGDNIDKMRGIT